MLENGDLRAELIVFRRIIVKIEMRRRVVEEDFSAAEMKLLQ